VFLFLYIIKSILLSLFKTEEFVSKSHLKRFQETKPKAKLGKRETGIEFMDHTSGVDGSMFQKLLNAKFTSSDPELDFAKSPQLYITFKTALRSY